MLINPSHKCCKIFINATSFSKEHPLAADTVTKTLLGKKSETYSRIYDNDFNH